MYHFVTAIWSRFASSDTSVCCVQHQPGLALALPTACGLKVSYWTSALGYHGLSLHIQKLTEQFGRRCIFSLVVSTGMKVSKYTPILNRLTSSLYLQTRSNYDQITDGKTNTSSLNNLQRLSWQVEGKAGTYPCSWSLCCLLLHKAAHELHPSSRARGSVSNAGKEGACGGQPRAAHQPDLWKWAESKGMNVVNGSLNSSRHLGTSASKVHLDFDTLSLVFGDIPTAALAWHVCGW